LALFFLVVAIDEVGSRMGAAWNG